MALPGRKEDDKGSAATLRWATRVLVSMVWISAAIFGLYIIAFYAGVAFDGAIDQWNAALPRLYEPDTPFATIGIGAHFAAGAIVLVLGPIQLIGAVRARAPWLHRWTGRVYVFAALASGLGGLAFIAVKGTIGGAWMNVGFSLYGGLVVVAAVATIWHARQRRFAEHRAWAIRLFALAIGSWLYRMDYGFWRNDSEWGGPHCDIRRAIRCGDGVLLLCTQLDGCGDLHPRAPASLDPPGGQTRRGACLLRRERFSCARHVLFHGLSLGTADHEAGSRGIVLVRVLPPVQ
jgi:hypothetical protein